jgi:FkbM family methyltransferase
MSIFNQIQKLTYKPSIVKIIQFLGLRKAMRRVYYFFARPKDNKKQVSFNGIDVQFYVSTPLELRLVETPLQNGMGDERDVLSKLLDAIRPGDTVYDVGASIGIHSTFMAKKAGQSGQVVAFEPEIQSYETLLENIKLNGLDNVMPINIALGDRSQESYLTSHGGTADFSLTEETSDNKSDQKVTVVHGDDFVREKSLPLPHLVKIDVEGYEYQVIQGLEKTLRNDECSMICCEVHPFLLSQGITSTDVTDLLQSFGFNRIETQPRGKTFHVFCYKT